MRDQGLVQHRPRGKQPGPRAPGDHGGSCHPGLIRLIPDLVSGLAIRLPCQVAQLAEATEHAFNERLKPTGDFFTRGLRIWMQRDVAQHFHAGATALCLDSSGFRGGSQAVTGKPVVHRAVFGQEVTNQLCSGRRPTLDRKAEQGAFGPVAFDQIAHGEHRRLANAIK